MHVALIDNTNKLIQYAEEITNQAAAARRFRTLALQADLNRAGANPKADKTADWQAYIGETPFAFPEPESTKKKGK